MSIPATQLRPGMIIKHNNDLHSVFSVEHRTPGNLRAFIQAKLRNLRTGAMFEHRFRSPDPIEKINVDEVEMEFLYADGDSYYFMDTANYEQTHLTKDILGDAVDYLIPNLEIKVEFFDGKAVGIELPQTVDPDGHRNRARIEERHRVQRDQAREDRDRIGRPGPAFHQRRREDQGGYLRRRVFVESVRIRPRVACATRGGRMLSAAMQTCSLDAVAPVLGAMRSGDCQPLENPAT